MGERHVTVYLRESVPMAARSRQLAVLGRLQTLADLGVIDRFEIEFWSNHITSIDPLGATQQSVYDQFERWARHSGTDIHPAFDAHDSICSFTDQSFRRTTFPVVCLTIYEDDELESVYPHTGTGGTQTVADGLAILEGLSTADAAAELDHNDVPTA